MRYTPEQATQDLVLYHSGTTDNEQLRYIQYMPQMEDRFPICWEGWAEEPGACFEDDPSPNNPNSGVKGEDTKNCSTLAHPAIALWGTAFVLGAARLRRKRSY
jgi:hypothetical protein